jgi:hypothetical protein
MGSLSQLVSALGAIGSIIGLGTSTISQVNMTRQQLSPPAQTAQGAPQCPAGTLPTVAFDDHSNRMVVCQEDVRP